MRDFILTLDCDWAPDFILDDVLARLERRKAHATLFVTHPSPALAGWRKSPRLELGWHPNFLPGSTQGKTPSEVADYLEAAAPGAASMRAHDLFQSTSLLRNFLSLAGRLRYDSSLYLPGQERVVAFDLHLGEGLRVRRFPFIWEDDIHLMEGGTGAFGLEQLATSGLCVVNFHPIHVYLNSAGFTAYRQVKALGPMPGLAKADLEAFRNPGEGIGTIFDRALERLAFTRNLAEAASGAAG